MLRILIPLAMVVSAVAGWWGFRRRQNDAAGQWRDSSLDDWRHQRAEREEREREDRLNGLDSPEGQDRP